MRLVLLVCRCGLREEWLLWLHLLVIRGENALLLVRQGGGGEGTRECGRRRHDPYGDRDPPTGIENQPLWPDFSILAETGEVATVVNGEDRSEAAGFEEEMRCVLADVDALFK